WQPMDNVAGHRRQAFRVGGGWVELLRREEERHSRLACCVHSHPDGEAELSKADIRSLAPGGQLLWPGLMQMVVATGKEGWREVAWFRPQGRGGGFICLGRWTRVCFEARKRGAFAI
ncbi:MAG: Mov34/MPN/PAD-1 family protein, partial [Cystobacterineae bacterium]|nr:Mov34/MPN/PAD-1 family protein [Cystobacterineae bacterium]